MQLLSLKNAVLNQQYTESDTMNLGKKVSQEDSEGPFMSSEWVCEKGLPRPGLCALLSVEARRIRIWGVEVLLKLLYSSVSMEPGMVNKQQV